MLKILEETWDGEETFSNEDEISPIKESTHNTDEQSASQNDEAIQYSELNEALSVESILHYSRDNSEYLELIEQTSVLAEGE